MRGTLLLTILNVGSSYQEAREVPISSENDVPDTVQWWISDAGSWRIKTYAIDHDIHTFRLEVNSNNLLDVARSNTASHYGDVTAHHYEIFFEDTGDPQLIERALRAHNLEPRLEVAENRFVFWKPDEQRYQTQSTPD